MRNSLKLGLALYAAFAAAPAHADVLSLRCTITPHGGRHDYSGYIWIYMQNRRAFEQWYPEGDKTSPHVDGPFGVTVLPNDVLISESASPLGKARTRINRANGSGTVIGGTIFCVGSNVTPPPLPAPPKPVRPDPQPVP